MQLDKIDQAVEEKMKSLPRPKSKKKIIYEDSSDSEEEVIVRRRRPRKTIIEEAPAPAPPAPPPIERQEPIQQPPMHFGNMLRTVPLRRPGAGWIR